MRRAPFAAAPLLLALSACVGAQSEPEMVRHRAASAFHCDAARVAVQKTRSIDDEDTLYQATACGQVAIYRCTWTTTALPNGHTPGAPLTYCKREPTPAP